MGDEHDRFARWLRAQVQAEVRVGPLERPDGAGLSNDTLLTEADWGAGARGLVVRLAPAGPALFPEYDLGAQVELLRALRASIPVPEVLWWEPDSTPMGRPFFVMERVDGRIPPDGHHFAGWVAELDRASQSRVLDSALAVMAAITRVGVGTFGFLDRAEHGVDPIDQELGWWRSYLDWASDGERFARAEDAYAWCVARRPRSVNAPGLVWGDARLGNLVVGDALEVRAVLDWEMACLGPPELDLGWFLFLERTALQYCVPLPGFPDRGGIVGAFERHLGRPVEHLDWYEAWGGVRAACIQVRLGRLLYDAGAIDDLAFRDRNPVTRALHDVVG